MRIIDPREQHARRLAPSMETGYRERVARRDRPRCGAAMVQIGEPCARFPGHGGGHRSAYDLDNAALMRCPRRVCA